MRIISQTEMNDCRVSLSLTLLGEANCDGVLGM